MVKPQPKLSQKSGQTLVELLVIIALLSLMLPVIFSAFMASRDGKAQQKQRQQAIQIFRETEEAVRIIREKGWSTFAVNGTYHPEIAGSNWDMVAGSDVVNGFTRSVQITDAYRDNNDNIVTTGGTADPSTKKITVTVSWTKPYNSSTSSTFYLTRYVANAAYTNDSVAEFLNITPTPILGNTQVDNGDGSGQVILSNNTKAKWCSPAFSSSTIDLPDGPPVAVSAIASTTSSTIANDIFAAVAPSTTTSVKLAHIQVPANVDPPAPVLRGTFTLDAAAYSNPSYVPSGIGLTNTFKTNDVKDYTSASGNVYALLATDIADHEVVVVQVSDGTNPTYQDPVNKIYKYHTFFNTKLYGSPQSPTLAPTNTPTPTFTPTPTPIGGSVMDTGFLSPSANAADTGGDGDGYQTNPTNGYSNNATFAVDTNSGNGTSTSCASANKDRHRYYNYNVSLTGATSIQGIEVQLDARVDSTTGAPQICAQMSWDGGTTWTTTDTTPTLTTTEATYTLGGSTDTWGRSWSTANFTNANFRLRLINVASSNSRDFSLDWAAVKVYYTGGTPTNTPTPTPTFTPTPTPTLAPGAAGNDQAPFGYGAKSITVLDDRGYVASGGYLYVFDLSNIDTKSSSNGLDMIGCRIQLDGYDCNPGSGTDRKYSAGQTGTTWGDTTSPAHNDCSDGGNIELYANNDLAAIQVGGNNYIYVAVGAGTNPELDIVNATNVPSTTSTPTLSSSSCGRASGGNSGWKTISSLDFNNLTNTEEAANSVFAKSDGSRAYVSSNGGIDANSDGQPDSKQFYVLNTTNKSSPSFLSGSGGGPTSGFYYGTNPNDDLFPRRSLTVLNGDRAVLVGKDGFSANAKNPKDYQVLDITTESTPAYCGGIDYDSGFNDLTSVIEYDHDTFVYMVANTEDKELKIIQGGPDGTFVDAGSFESGIFNPGSSVTYNSFTATGSTPASTSINIQVAVADPVSGSCNNAVFNYVGPDGTSATSYTLAGGKIPVVTNGTYNNPGQCMKYKANLTTTDYNNTPSLTSIYLNYSP